VCCKGLALLAGMSLVCGLSMGFGLPDARSTLGERRDRAWSHRKGAAAGREEAPRTLAHGGRRKSGRRSALLRPAPLDE
jgi:hypothetical protein